jgi:aarF domain-containing kinase
MTFIDAGIVVKLEPEDRRNFIDLFSAVVLKDSAAVGRLMVERSRGKQCIDRLGFETKMAAIVNEVHSHGLNLGRISVGKLLQEILVLCYVHEVKLESRFANLLVAIGVLEGLGRRLDPDIDLILRATPFILKSALKY